MHENGGRTAESSLINFSRRVAKLESKKNILSLPTGILWHSNTPRGVRPFSHEQ